MRVRLLDAALGVVLVLSFLLSPSLGEDVKLRVCAWNVESGGASSNVNATRIKNEDGVDIWGLSEVKNASDAAKYLIAAQDGEPGDFESILGTTGGPDRLLILYNSEKLDLLESEELHSINIGGNVRAPLVAKFRENATGKEFFYMVNHLYRSNESARHTQAKLINNWAESKPLPTITVGDFNFDFHYLNGWTDHDEGFDYLQEDGVFTWIEPEVKVPTNSSNHKSILDFVFVSGAAMTWPAKSTILVQDGEFPDGTLRSDHRPVDCVFTLSSDSEPLSPTRIGIARARELVRDDAEEGEMEDETRPGRAPRRTRVPSETGNEALLKKLDALQQQIDELRELLQKQER